MKQLVSCLACHVAYSLVAFGLVTSTAVAGSPPEPARLAVRDPGAPICTAYYIVSEFGPANPFMAVEARGMQAAARQLHIHAVFSGPTGTEGSIPIMESLLRSAIAAHPCGIATQLADPTALNAPIEGALAKGIPVVLWNAQDFKRSNGAISRLQYIGQDETTSGEKLATHLAPDLHAGDTVVYGMDFPGELVGTYRYRGVKAGLSAHGIRTVLVDVGSDPTRGVAILDAYISSHPGVKAIVSNGIPSAEAAVDYAKEKGKEKLILASFDMGPQIVTAIEQGYQLFALDQQPYLQAYLAIIDLYQMRQGFGAFSANTGTLFVDQANVADFARLTSKGIGG